MENGCVPNNINQTVQHILPNRVDLHAYDSEIDDFDENEAGMPSDGPMNPYEPTPSPPASRNNSESRPRYHLVSGDTDGEVEAIPGDLHHVANSGDATEADWYSQTDTVEIPGASSHPGEALGAERQTHTWQSEYDAVQQRLANSEKDVNFLNNVAKTEWHAYQNAKLSESTYMTNYM